MLKFACNSSRDSVARTGISNQSDLKKVPGRALSTKKLAVTQEVFEKDSRELASITKRGWLKKKGQRRYFILDGSTLLWFTKEQPEKVLFFFFFFSYGKIDLLGCFFKTFFILLVQ